MITNKQIKSLFYLDRDTDVIALADDILKTKKAELIVFLRRQHERLQEKDVGEYFTVEDTTKLKDGELEKMMRFFRGAIVPYYTRQSRDIWTESISSSVIMECTDEIKSSVGFVRYNHDGHITDQVNSLATFERIKDFSQFLEMVENVCFLDNGFIFPDSKKFKGLEKTKGREATQRQMFHELHEQIKNKFAGREIIK